MAKVPDLGSDFAQKLLKDLRRRRERLGFESAAAPRSTANVASRDANSNSQKPLQIRNPQQAAPLSGRAESTTNRLYRQGSNSIAGGARKPRNHGAPPTAHSHAIVPFQGGGGSKQKAPHAIVPFQGGGGSKPKAPHAIVPFQGGGGSKPKAPAGNVDLDMQMALALALSNRGKLQNIQLVESNGGNYLLSPIAHVGKVAIGVQKLNDILMAYTSGAAGTRGGFDKRGSVEVGKQLLRGAMDLEESLNMLMMLQEASDYMGASGNNGKVLLIEGKESRRSSSHSSSSARLVEIVDEDSEAELGSDAKTSSDASSMQIVPLRKSQGPSANHRSGLQLTAVANRSKSSVTSGGEEDDSKVRMPNLIAKLMGLENLPSAKVVVAERKVTERFVRPDAVPRETATKNPTFGTLPIRIVGSEGVPSKGQIKNFLAREWNIRLTKSEESECATAMSNRSSHLTSDKQTMRQGSSRQENTERRAGVTQAVDEKTVHQRKKLTEESKLQKTVGVGCRSDRKMNFLQRFRKNPKSKPVTEEKDIIQGNNKELGKMQATGTKQSGIDREVKSRRTRAKFNKENLSSAENKPEVRSGKTDQLRSKQTNKQIVDKRLQNYCQIQNETANQILEHNRSLESETTHTKEKIEYTTLMQLKDGESTKEDDTAGCKPSHKTPSDDAIFRQSAAQMKSVNTAREVSSNESEKQLPEEIKKDPAAVVAQTSAGSIAETTVDSVNQTASEAAQTLEIFSEGQQQQQQQLQQTKDADDQPRNDFDHSNPTDSKIDAVSCDSFTETQLLLKEMLLKDQYLLETAKSITRIHVPVISTVHVDTGKWLDKGNKVLSDVGREVIRRKGKRTEATVDVSVARPAATQRLQTLDDLIRELDADIQSLDIPKQRDDNPAEHLKMVLRRDIESARSDANSVWDFAWNRIRELPIEKNEVVKDLEKNILGGIITDVARELIDVSTAMVGVPVRLD